MADILIVMGSDSDLPVVSIGLKILKEFGVSFDVHFSSAHRSPEMTTRIVSEFEQKGGEVIIAAAGMSAHLAGVIAAHTVLPVIGLPLSSADFGSLDSLFSMVEMPPGIPVGVVGRGKAGAKNAALLAIQILSLSNDTLAKKIVDYRKAQTQIIVEKDAKLQEEGWENYTK